jgi:hypothetical protein
VDLADLPHPGLRVGRKRENAAVGRVVGVPGGARVAVVVVPLGAGGRDTPLVGGVVDELDDVEGICASSPGTSGSGAAVNPGWSPELIVTDSSVSGQVMAAVARVAATISGMATLHHIRRRGRTTDDKSLT